MRKPCLATAAAIALVLATTCFWYSLKDGSMASFKQTAFAAMVWTSGPPWVPGKVSLSSSLAKGALQRTMPPRGPRNVLCVVVETMSACGTGLGWRSEEHTSELQSHV